VTFVLALLFTSAWLWHDPGQVERVDFTKPAAGASCPHGPFTFIEEGYSGASAKVLVRDSAGIQWQVKGGPEARADAFSTRLVGALGYYAEAICFLAEGRIDGIKGKLRRADGFIKPDGSFTWASFERRDPLVKFLAEAQWNWTGNPFAGSRELKGLKVLTMLLSNWDNKDGRNTWQGSNTGILESEGKRIYFVTDWGQSLGSWRGLLLGSPWDCSKYREQTAHFVEGTRQGKVLFGFRGQHTRGFSGDITADDVAWLMQYLGRVTPAQIRLGLLASGATPAEQECFSSALLGRIEQLRSVVTRKAALR
jgi:hypothetical protein